MKEKKVLICGAGAIGVYLGTNLYVKKHDVKLFGRRKLKGINDHVLINNKPFKIPEKNFKIPKKEDFDFIFITTKLYDFPYMINLIKKNKIKGEIFSSIQNGLVDISRHMKKLKHKITPITIFSGFNLNKNNLNVHTTKIGWVTEYSKDGKKISYLLCNSGVPCKAVKNFGSLRAEKTIVNCCLNALSAIEKKSFLELFKNKKISERISDIFKECYDILSKEYDLDDKEEIRNRMLKHWSKLDHYSSTYQDIHSGRKNEAKFFNGYIIKLGKKHDLPTPYNQDILNKIAKI